MFGSSTPRHGLKFFDKWHHSASCGRLLGTLLRSSPMVFLVGWGVCFLFLVGVVLWVRSFSQSDLRTSGVVLFMGNIHEEFLAVRVRRYEDLLDELNRVWFGELDQLNGLMNGWGIEQTGGNICVFAFYFADNSEYEDGHFLLVSPEDCLGVEREELLNRNWLVGHYGLDGDKGNTSECDSFSSFGDAVKEVERVFFAEGVI